MFERDNITAEIIDVFLIRRKPFAAKTPARPFAVLSRRLSGSSEFYEKGKTFHISEKSVLYIPSDTEYSQKSDVEETIIAIHLNVMNASGERIESAEADSAEINRLFGKIYCLWSKKEKNYKYRCTSLLYRLLAEISEKPNTAAEYPLVRKSAEYIDANFRKPITVGELARSCFVSENYYRRMFAVCFGVSPSKYIADKRIAAAKSLIVSGYYNMTEISEMCGFSSQKYFCSAFRKALGKTPTEYAKSKNSV